jgi:hypothetical protein
MNQKARTGNFPIEFKSYIFYKNHMNQGTPYMVGRWALLLLKRGSE